MSKFARHLLDNEHSIGPIENITDTVHSNSKGRMLDTMEKFYKETKINNQINDKWTVRPNIIFKTLVQKGTNRVHTTPQQTGHLVTRIDYMGTHARTSSSPSRNRKYLCILTTHLYPYYIPYPT
jgi:hypothetical protein